MNVDLGALSIAAVSIGFLHTLLGPDHYVPFVAMSRAGGWSFRKTLVVTLLCGVAHVGSSVLLGFVGLALGLILQMETIEEHRGNVAGWLLIGFGLAYSVWGLLHALRSRAHTHLHSHTDGTIHAHEHGHFGGHLHPHGEQAASEAAAAGGASATKRDRSASITPWVLFTIFAFGPCEPLIPLLIYPAAKADLWSVACVTALFALTTLATMTSMVFLVSAGTSVLRFDKLGRYSHALAGLVLLSCGLAVKAGL
jgi:ABC-type nickel/cobalt efflux system permease component RcnA